MRVPPAWAFALCTLIWGTTWLAIKVGYEGLPAVWGASLRFLIAGLLLLPFSVTRATLPTSRRAIAVVLFVGFFLFGVDYGLIYWGEQYLPSGLTAVLFSTTPLFVVLFSAGLLRAERLGPRQLLGIVVGLGGVAMIYAHDLRVDLGRLGPVFAIAGSAAAAGISSVVVRRWGRDIEPRTLNAYAMLIGAAVLFAASRGLGEEATWPTTGRAWASLVYLALAGSVVSFLLYWELLRAWPAHRAILITLIVPVVAVLTGVAVGERLAPLQWLGSGVVLAGVGLSLRRVAPAARPTGIAK